MLRLFLSFSICLALFDVVVFGHWYGHGHHHHGHHNSHHHCLKDWKICDLFGHANKCCSGYCRKDHTSAVPQCYPSNGKQKCSPNGNKCKDDSNCCSQRCVKQGCGWRKGLKKGKCQPRKPIPKASTTTTTTTVPPPPPMTIRVTTTTISSTTSPTTTTTPSTAKPTPICYDTNDKCQYSDECCSKYCSEKEGVCTILDINQE